MSFSFKRNVGSIDRMVRLVLGVIALYTTLFQPFALGTIWSFVFGIVGMVLIITSLIAY